MDRGYLAVEDVIWCVLLKLEIPQEYHTVWVMGDVGVSEVADQQKLRVLGAGDSTSGPGI